MALTASRVRPAGHAVRRVAAPFVTLLVLLPAGAAAQDRPAQAPPTNLQVLPKEWTRQQVVQVMRNFTVALGARCSDCHVEDDDASDAKPMKEQARAMIRMTTVINDTHLSGLPEREEPNVRVTCITCHRGVARPEPIELNSGGDGWVFASHEVHERSTDPRVLAAQTGGAKLDETMPYKKQ